MFTHSFRLSSRAPAARRTGRLSAVLLLMTGLVLASSRTAIADVETTVSYRITTHCPQHLASAHGPGNLAGALDQARNCDTMAVNAKLYAPYASAMLNANPKLRLLVYLNGGMCPRDNAPGTARACPGTYLTDKTGAYIRASVTRNWLMRPQSLPWADGVERNCRQQLATWHVTSPRVGCYFDMLGLGALNGMMTGLPIKPGTTSAYSQTGWMAEIDWLTSRLAGNLSASQLYAMGNGIHSGQYFEAWTAPLLRYMPFAAENSWRSPPKLGGTLLNRWLANQRMFAAADKPITITAKGWAGEDLEFTLGSHVLFDKVYSAPGTPWSGLGNPYSWTTTSGNSTEYHPEVRKLREGFLAQRGGAATKLPNGAYRMEFVRTYRTPSGSTVSANQGWVYVNPTDTKTVSVTLDARYALLDGRQLPSGTVLTIGPQHALIMHRS